jgi:hypothetical protein
MLRRDQKFGFDVQQSLEIDFSIAKFSTFYSCINLLTFKLQQLTP